MDEIMRLNDVNHDGQPLLTRMSLMDGMMADPWDGQAKYARGVCYFAVAVIGLFAVANLIHQTRRAFPRKGAAALSVPGLRHLSALLRSVGYRQPRTLSLAKGDRGSGPPAKDHRRASALRSHLPLWLLPTLRFPAVGPSLLILAFFVTFVAWAFSVKPYYRPLEMSGSPPLALRAGWMALGMVPFSFALSSKVNFVSLLTGLGHERLQVYHQWGARIMLFFATIHTVPFIVMPMNYGGASMLNQYYYSDNIFKTGTIAFACLFWLVFSSFADLRSLSYEFFVVHHIVVAVVFLAYLFIHCENILTSWNFLASAAGLYGASVFLRLAYQAYTNDFFSLSRALIEPFPGDFTRLTLVTPARWEAGQHVFVRLPTINPLQSHPFTVVTLPSPDEHFAYNRLVLVARTRSGFTQRLHKLASRTAGAKTVPALFDGPYGGCASLAMYECVAICVGGSGATFGVSVLLDAVRRIRDGTGVTKSICFVWAVRRAESIFAVADFLRTAVHLAPPGTLSVSFHVTGDGEGEPVSSSWPTAHATSLQTGATFLERGHRGGAESVKTESTEEDGGRSDKKDDEDDNDLERAEGPSSGAHTPKSSQPFRDPAAKEAAAVEDACPLIVGGLRALGFDEAGPWRMLRGRPNLPSLLDRFVAEADSSGGGETKTTVAVASCGPEDFAHDVANKVARLNLELLTGRRRGLAEVYLVNERFGW